ncbi:Imm51 family immunity protein [Pimelobacter simplex]|uniref:Imm51 family immunity protein n=1 Tax=Nocardioides simplex TaxID=2045 RepID=UPI001931D2B4|nr:hypothetical protein [Pimelobacter simplex]
MAESIQVHRVPRQGYDCTFYCGALGADAAIHHEGHEPNGYFLEGLLRYLDPDLAEAVELDSEAGMFSVFGKRRQMKKVQRLLSPYLHDGDRVTTALRAAEAENFQFDD